MSQEDESVVQFLVGLGVFTEEDERVVRAAQVGPIVRRMVEKKALNPVHVGKARELVAELMSGSNHTRRLKAQMSLMQLVTGKMHDRMTVSRDKIRRHKEKITSGNYPIVPQALAKAEGD